MPRFETRARITLDGVVAVEAADEDDARARFTDLDWLKDGPSWDSRLELIDWDAGDRFVEVDDDGRPKEGGE